MLKLQSLDKYEPARKQTLQQKWMLAIKYPVYALNWNTKEAENLIYNMKVTCLWKRSLHEFHWVYHRHSKTSLSLLTAVISPSESSSGSTVDSFSCYTLDEDTIYQALMQFITNVVSNMHAPKWTALKSNKAGTIFGQR